MTNKTKHFLSNTYRINVILHRQILPEVWRCLFLCAIGMEASGITGEGHHFLAEGETASVRQSLGKLLG